MTTARASTRDRDLVKIRRRQRFAGALYVLACLLPAGTFAAIILQAWISR